MTSDRQQSLIGHVARLGAICILGLTSLTIVYWAMSSASGYAILLGVAGGLLPTYVAGVLLAPYLSDAESKQRTLEDCANE